MHGRATVKSRWRTALILVTVALGAASAPTHAGSIGRTSRGTVSISVIIPPRVLVRRGFPGTWLCVIAIGLGGYSAEMTGTAGATGTRAIDRAADRRGGGTWRDRRCGADAEVVPMPGASAAVALAARRDDPAPPTLLIVPE